MKNNEYMKVAIEEANINMKENFVNGGPFGAVIVKDGKIISRAHNTVLKSKDATAHAEVNAIREASKVLNTHDLSGCILYTSAEPCPMCLSAIIWANIKEVYYANTKEEANEIKNDSVDDTMKLFVYYCNNGEISKAYSMLTDDCKNAMFKTEKQFKDIYVKSIFNGTRDYTMIKWSTDANKTVCQVQFFADMLATGGGEGNKTQEYYTFIKNNDGSYKMNINNFIYASVEDINNEQNNIKVKITKVEVYDSYEEYTISITNNREKEICLTGNKYNKNLYLKGENGATYSSLNFLFIISMVNILVRSKKKY